ncbi:TfoX/Sxy family protein [Ahrensia sp. 13_GOM-1096m]|uniref:TfoX/Sxy family protein n=1 Tax=Ahrensia sp. 13_GOM-1096m TaxID=1380380 RepID=UPI00047CDA9C|nr:TfoX/Sxy family protein [Ahrensia sp. 13_GOM-1096m]
MDEDFLRDLFASIAPLSFRKMFGGLGIYTDGLIFAVILKGELMLKGDEHCCEQFEAAGMTRWTYNNSKSGKKVLMPYWSAPEQAMESAEDMAPFAQLAFAAALRAKKT